MAPIWVGLVRCRAFWPRIIQSDRRARTYYRIERVQKTSAIPPTDEAVVRAIADGDQESLRVLNQRYGPALAAVAERILGNRADAEEVAADVLWQAWRQAAAFDRSRGSVAAWLMVLARSRAIDRLRARAARAIARDALDAATEPSVTPDASLVIHSEQRRRVVQTVMAGLQDNERSLLEMAYFSDLTQSIIAERTGLPLGTVKSRIRSAMIKLREGLKDLGD
jgi:RNA polymerase sigma-70 factor (ECF subfamily)